MHIKTQARIKKTMSMSLMWKTQGIQDRFSLKVLVIHMDSIKGLRSQMIVKMKTCTVSRAISRCWTHSRHLKEVGKGRDLQRSQGSRPTHKRAWHRITQRISPSYRLIKMRSCRGIRVMSMATASSRLINTHRHSPSVRIRAQVWKHNLLRNRRVMASLMGKILQLKPWRSSKREPRSLKRV